MTMIARWFFLPDVSRRKTIALSSLPVVVDYKTRNALLKISRLNKQPRGRLGFLELKLERQFFDSLVPKCITIGTTINWLAEWFSGRNGCLPLEVS